MKFVLGITDTQNLGEVGVPSVSVLKILPDLILTVAVKMERGDTDSEGELKLAKSESHETNKVVCVKERVNEYEHMLHALDDSSNDDSEEKAPVDLFQRQTAEDDNTFISSLLTIVPAEELEFYPTEENSDGLDIISLTNITEKHVAYKVKTTSPEKYRVRPTTGVIQPNSHADVNVCLHTVPATEVRKDRFLIMFMEVEPEFPASQVNDLFRVTSRKNYNEHRLCCRQRTVKAVVDSSTPVSSKTSDPEQLNKLSKQVHKCPGSKIQQTEVDSVSMGSRITGPQSELLEIWQEEYDEMETLLSSHQRLESQMGQLKKFIFLLVGVVLLFLLTIFLTYWTEQLPVNKYTVNACVPHYL